MTSSGVKRIIAWERRSLLLALGFLMWGAVIVGRLSHFMLLHRDSYLTQMTREAVVEGTIPALRGRLLDRNGQLLAWSTRTFVLTWRVPRSAPPARSDLSLVAACTPLAAAWSDRQLTAALGRTVTLKSDLRPAEVKALASLTQTCPRFAVRSVFQRFRRPEPALAGMLGEVVVVDGVEVGVSGLEKAHDSLLRGRSGVYRVMHDSRGEWLPETWRLIRELCPGYDVYLPIKIEDYVPHGNATDQR